MQIPNSWSIEQKLKNFLPKYLSFSNANIFKGKKSFGILQKPAMAAFFGLELFYTMGYLHEK